MTLTVKGGKPRKKKSVHRVLTPQGFRNVDGTPIRSRQKVPTVSFENSNFTRSIRRAIARQRVRARGKKK